VTSGGSPSTGSDYYYSQQHSVTGSYWKQLEALLIKYASLLEYKDGSIPPRLSLNLETLGMNPQTLGLNH
jgi:hypothetical protein